jgi:hypothetical protein
MPPSLVKWLAFWAIGNHYEMFRSRERIREIFRDMFRLRHDLLPQNREFAGAYLQKVWEGVETYCEGLRKCPQNTLMLEKFEDYFNNEEARLKKNLNDVKYHIDDLEGLSLVAGPGRIEKV